jgi:hypothetical protein
MYFSLQAVSLKKAERKTLSNCLRLKSVNEFLSQMSVNNFPCGSPWHVLGLQKKQTDAVFNNNADSKSASQRTKCLPTIAQFAQLFKHRLRIELLGQVEKAFS